MGLVSKKPLCASFLLTSFFSFSSCSSSILIAPENVAAQGTQVVNADPPECGGCLFLEARANLSNKLEISPERTAIERVRIRGTVYESDGKTPAKNVLMYFYQTDETGVYSKRGDEPRNSYAWWHGKQRGFLKTNHRGEYQLDTIKPAPYPSRDEPAHIHAVVKAPSQKNDYSISDFVFADDELLSQKFWKNTEDWWQSMGVYQNPNYGGLKLTRISSQVWEARRDIRLFSEYDLPMPSSGLDILAEIPAFEPRHAWGLDKGSYACPMDKYGDRPGILYWVNSDEDWYEIGNWAKWLEKLSVRLGERNFKAYLIYTNPKRLTGEELQNKLSDLGQRLSLKKIALTYVPSVDDRPSKTYRHKINRTTRNTFVVYNNRKIVDKFTNLMFIEQNAALLHKSVERAGRDKALYK